MADKITVEVTPIATGSGVDGKHAGLVKAPMQQAAEKAVKGAGFDLVKSPAKGTKGLCLVGSLESLGADAKGQKLLAKVGMAIATLSDKSIKATVTGIGGFEIAKADIKDADLKEAAVIAVGEAMKSALPYMKKTKPG